MHDGCYGCEKGVLQKKKKKCGNIVLKSTYIRYSFQSSLNELKKKKKS